MCSAKSCGWKFWGRVKTSGHSQLEGLEDSLVRSELGKRGGGKLGGACGGEAELAGTSASWVTKALSPERQPRCVSTRRTTVLAPLEPCLPRMLAHLLRVLC